MNRLQEKKLNNKGFSLVELIIVIAIMAVLIGVLAPQYIKYVEKSRQSADLDNYQSIITAIQTYAADNAGLSTASIMLEKATKYTFNSDSGNWIDAAVAETGVTSVTMSSTLYGTATVTATVDDKGYLTISTDVTELNTALGL